LLLEASKHIILGFPHDPLPFQCLCPTIPHLENARLESRRNSREILRYGKTSLFKAMVLKSETRMPQFLDTSKAKLKYLDSISAN